MNNLNEIIQKSLGLINYDRSKPLDEQLTLGIPNFLFPEKEKKATYKQKPLNIVTPSYADESDTPFVTLKSVVKNQDIYIPLRKVIEKVKTPEKDFLKGLQSKYGKISTTIPNDLKSFYKFQ